MTEPAKNKTTHFPKAIALAVVISGSAAQVAHADECSDMITEVTAAAVSANITTEEADRIEQHRTAALQKQTEGDANGCVSELQKAADLLNLD